MDGRSEGEGEREREREHREQEEAASDWFLSWLCPTLSAISAIVRTRRGLPAATAAAAATVAATVAAAASCGEATTAGAATPSTDWRLPSPGGGANHQTVQHRESLLHSPRKHSTVHRCLRCMHTTVYMYTCIYMYTYKQPYQHTFRVCVRTYESFIHVRMYTCTRENESTRERAVSPRAYLESAREHIVESGTGCKATTMTTGNGIAWRSLCSQARTRGSAWMG